MVTSVMDTVWIILENFVELEFVYVCMIKKLNGPMKVVSINTGKKVNNKLYTKYWTALWVTLGPLAAFLLRVPPLYVTRITRSVQQVRNVIINDHLICTSL